MYVYMYMCVCVRICLCLCIAYIHTQIHKAITTRITVLAPHRNTHIRIFIYIYISMCIWIGNKTHGYSQYEAAAARTQIGNNPLVTPVTQKHIHKINDKLLSSLSLECCPPHYIRTHIHTPLTYTTQKQTHTLQRNTLAQNDKKLISSRTLCNTNYNTHNTAWES